MGGVVDAVAHLCRDADWMEQVHCVGDWTAIILRFQIRSIGLITIASLHNAVYR